MHIYGTTTRWSQSATTNEQRHNKHRINIDEIQNTNEQQTNNKQNINSKQQQQQSSKLTKHNIDKIQNTNNQLPNNRHNTYKQSTINNKIQSNITKNIKSNNLNKKKSQNTKNNQQYKMTKEPLPITDKEYPKLSEYNTIRQKENSNKKHTDNDPIIIPEMQTIPETSLEQIQEEQQQPEIEFLSPSLVKNTTKNQDIIPSLNPGQR